MLKRIPLDQIRRNPDQPRQHFDEKALRELAESIRENGLQQPITVRPIPGGFMIVAGERRYRAHRLLAEEGVLSDVLCHVRKMDDETMHVQAILENLQRADVSPIEEAIAYQRMIDDYGYTVPELAKKLGISQTWRITDRTQLLGLTADNRALLEKGIVTLTQAWHMAGLSPNGQQEFLRICRQGLANTNKAAEAAAAAIRAREDQMGMDLGTPAPRKPRASVKTEQERIKALADAIAPLFKDGAYSAPENVDPEEALRCVQELQLLQNHLGRIRSELQRAATVSAAA